jgi:hypothetical protein
MTMTDEPETMETYCMIHSVGWQYRERGKWHCLGCLRDSWRAGSDELIRLSAEIVRCGGMPSPYRDDWPKRLRWVQVQRVADHANDKAKGWAIRLRNIIDSIHGR